MQYSCSQRLGAEFLGTAFLLATVIGSGIMGAKLADGNDALALLGNTLPTGAILVVLITMLGPISGAHFNPGCYMRLLAAERDQSSARGLIRACAAFRGCGRRVRGTPDVRPAAVTAFREGPQRPSPMVCGVGGDVRSGRSPFSSR